MDDKDLAKEIAKKKKVYKAIEWITPGRGYEVTYKGMFNYQQFYQLMYDMLQNLDYSGINGDKDSVEITYEDRNTGGFQEIWHRWRTSKSFNGWSNFYMFIDTHVIGISNAELMVEGKKVKTHTAEVNFFIRCGLEWSVPLDKVHDAVKGWAGADGQKLFTKYYDDERDVVYSSCYDDALTMLDALRQYLGLPVSDSRNVELFRANRRGVPMLNSNAPDYTPNTDE